MGEIELDKIFSLSYWTDLFFPSFEKFYSLRFESEKEKRELLTDRNNAASYAIFCSMIMMVLWTVCFIFGVRMLSINTLAFSTEQLLEVLVVSVSFWGLSFFVLAILSLSLILSALNIKHAHQLRNMRAMFDSLKESSIVIEKKDVD